MEIASPEFLNHCLPLVAISGLVYDKETTGREDGPAPDLSNHPLSVQGELLASHSLPEISTPLASELRNRFTAKSHRPKIWEPDAVEVFRRKLPHLLNIAFVSRDYRLPPIKSQADGSQDPAAYPDRETHSILSPLHPKSTLYPDGLISEEWLQKYQYLVPSTLISFHHLTADTSDEHLAHDINSVKSQVSKRNIKLLVAILSDISPSDDPSINDRIQYLRKATSLAPRTGLLLASPGSEVEKETFVETICQLVYAQSQDFYSTLAKRIRKRRGKINLPEYFDELTKPPLTNVGWQVRYHFKLAIMAEFRQELDVASKSYESTYEAALEMFETLDPLQQTSPERWQQARSFLDSIAFKITKLYLYLDQATTAYRKFRVHISNLSSLLKKRGFSDKSYSYLNWISRQYLFLAQLVRFAHNKAVDDNDSLALASDDIFAVDRLPRSGFLFLRVVDYLNQMSTIEDAGEEEPVDPYLSREKFAINHEDASLALLQNASKDFSISSSHFGGIGYSLYALGETCFKKGDLLSSLKYFKEASKIYRRSHWNPVLANVLRRISEISLSLGHEYNEDRLLALLELSLVETAKETGIEEGLSAVSISDTGKPIFNDRYGLKLLSAQFAFEKSECNSGELLVFQIVLSPSSNSNRSGMKLSSLTCEFSGSLPSVHIEHDSEVTYSEFADLNADQTNLKANLSFKPSETIKVLNIRILPTQLGEAQIKNITAVLEKPEFQLKFNVPVSPAKSVTPWYKKEADREEIKVRHIKSEDSHKIKLSPRAPQIKLSLDQVSTVASGEKLLLNLIVDNKEVETVNLEVVAKGISAEGNEVELRWKSSQLDSLKDVKQESGTIQKYPLEVQVPFSRISAITLEFLADYTLESQPTTQLKDAVSISFPVATPFRVNFDVNPRVNDQKWDSMFIADESASQSPFIIKTWELSSTILYLGQDQVEILGSSLDISSPSEAKCEIIQTPSDDDQTAKMLRHNDSQRLSYKFNSSRSGVADIRNITAEAQLRIKWRRNGQLQLVNEFLVPSIRLTLPLIEPRVIVDVAKGPNASAITISYHIENATSHILSYAVSMGSSDVFAFQGPKQVSLRLLPFTKKCLEYNLMPMTTGSLKLPNFKVHDTYYKRTLTLAPANALIKSDKLDLFIEC